MQCEFCGKKIRSTPNGLVCKKCEEGSFLARASNFGYMQWVKSLEVNFDNYTWRNVKIRVAQMIKVIQENFPAKDFSEQVEILDQSILDEINLVLSFYHKDDLVVATLSIKEACRTSMLNPKDSDHWSIQNEYSMAVLLQREIMLIDDESFMGAPIETLDHGYYGFITALVYARVLMMLRDNYDKYKFLKHTDSLMEMAFTFYEDESMNKYFDRYLNDGISEKPEDLFIQNIELKMELTNRGIIYEEIREDIVEEVKKQFGVTFKDLKEVFNTKALMLGKSDNILPVKITRKDKLINQKRDGNFIEASIDLFSINKIPKYISSPSDSHYELRSIYEVGDFIVFGEIDLIQNISIFEKLVISGHFLTMYNDKASLTSAFKKSQTKLSSLFAFKLTESLSQSKYIVPTEMKNGKQIVRAEINNILGYDKKNILKKKDGMNLGDIDAMAINLENHEVILYELKFFKPAVSFKEMLYSDKRKLVNDEIVRKMMNRQDAVEENLDAVIAFIGGDQDINYTVKSVLVTIRSNYYCFYEDVGVEFVTWNELHDSLKMQDAQ
ncbi:hypothetical protein MKZ24_08570 [Paenibacillus sp. FSL R7-0297]|uniref:hypothetical protein n=1 Tax=unclassified Paenibacillus TaxID=185978 RepID=UPI0003E2AA91|nr:hypothetical protein [Paenibacillus sp. FSL R7-269]ETT49754.1 hypothetical protein C162_12748 [Paenibacillus sp. FSL R7-269]